MLHAEVIFCNEFQGAPGRLEGEHRDAEAAAGWATSKPEIP
jgi:hypothetical protein